MDGIGFELQSDSIEGDGGGVQAANLSSLPLDLTAGERTRLATTVASVGGNSFTDFRLAMGLYYRGYSADGKNFVERLTGQNAAIAALISTSGVQGVDFLHWSPAPYWKKNTISGTTYRGSTTTFADPVADPTGYNTITRRLLQGGSLDHPDKTLDPTGYATWMDDFTNAVLADMEYVHANVGRVVKFSPQNEPLTSAAYPSCVWTNQDVYDFLKVIVPKIRASVGLSTYGGSPNTVNIYVGDGVGATLIGGDAALLAEIYGWSWHLISETGNDADYMKVNGAGYVAISAGKAVFSDENEYLDPYVDPSYTATYKTDDWRFANTALMPLTWFVYLNSPSWYWIHIGKPTNGPTYESIGRALTIWRPPGAPASVPYPALGEGEFTTVDVNWNAIKPWVQHMPRGSVRQHCTQSAATTGVGVMVWKKPNTDTVIALVNRTAAAKTFRVVIVGHTGTLAGLQYSATTRDVALGSQSISGNVFMVTVPAYSAQFWTGAVS